MLRPSVITGTHNIALTILPPYDSGYHFGYILPLDNEFAELNVIQYRCFYWDFEADNFRTASFDNNDLVTFYSKLKPNWDFYLYEETRDFDFFDCDHLALCRDDLRGQPLQRACNSHLQHREQQAGAGPWRVPDHR